MECYGGSFLASSRIDKVSLEDWFQYSMAVLLNTIYVVGSTRVVVVLELKTRSLKLVQQHFLPENQCFHWFKAIRKRVRKWQKTISSGRANALAAAVKLWRVSCFCADRRRYLKFDALIYMPISYYEVKQGMNSIETSYLLSSPLWIQMPYLEEKEMCDNERCAFVHTLAFNPFTEYGSWAYYNNAHFFTIF